MLQAIKQEKLDIVWRVLFYFSFIENNNDDVRDHLQYSLFVIDILNQLVLSKSYTHPYYAEM